MKSQEIARDLGGACKMFSSAIFRKAAAGAPFHIRDKASGKRFLAQLKPLDENLKSSVKMNNILDAPKFLAELHEAVTDQGLAVFIYEKWVVFVVV